MSDVQTPTDTFELRLILSNGIPGQEFWVNTELPPVALTISHGEFIKRYMEPLVARMQAHVRNPHE